MLLGFKDSRQCAADLPEESESPFIKHSLQKTDECLDPRFAGNAHPVFSSAPGASDDARHLVNGHSTAASPAEYIEESCEQFSSGEWRSGCYPLIAVLGITNESAHHFVFGYLLSPQPPRLCFETCYLPFAAALDHFCNRHRRRVLGGDCWQFGENCFGQF